MCTLVLMNINQRNAVINVDICFICDCKTAHLFTCLATLGSHFVIRSRAGTVSRINKQSQVYIREVGWTFLLLGMQNCWIGFYGHFLPKFKSTALKYSGVKLSYLFISWMKADPSWILAVCFPWPMLRRHPSSMPKKAD